MSSSFKAPSSSISPNASSTVITCGLIFSFIIFGLFAFFANYYCLLSTEEASDVQPNKPDTQVRKDIINKSIVVQRWNGPSKGGEQSKSNPDQEKGIEAVVNTSNSKRNSRQASKQGVVCWREADLDNPECPICLTEFQKQDIICTSKNESCRHGYHVQCITRWLQNHDECPMCKRHFLLIPPV